jgi:hypothetical protein
MFWKREPGVFVFGMRDRLADSPIMCGCVWIPLHFLTSDEKKSLLLRSFAVDMDGLYGDIGSSWSEVNSDGLGNLLWFVMCEVSISHCCWDTL